MDDQDQRELLTDLADGLLAGPEWERWLAEHPDAAAQVLVLRQVRTLVAELRSSPVAVPDDFEARVMARVRGDATMRALLELSLPQLGAALLELLSALFGLLPQPVPERPARAGGD